MGSAISLVCRKYQYTSLQPGPVFRYLVLNPGQVDEALTCSLKNCALDEAPGYEAISYVWGVPPGDETIRCDGRKLKITKSLANVLKRMRLMSEPRVLWADAICINQEDEKEKGHQVALMGQIYRGAQRVLIYLGEDEAGHAKPAIAFAQDIDEEIRSTCSRIDGPWAALPWLKPDHPFLDDTRWKSLAALYHCPWFGRGWVVQEAGLAQAGLVIWGRYETSWAALVRVDTWICRRAITCRRIFDLGIPALHWYLYFGRHVNEAQFFTGGNPGDNMKLLNTLESARELKLTDNRDRIYAFLDVMSLDEAGSETALTLHPNYKQDFLKVYEEFAIQYFRTKRKAELLDYVQQTGESMDTKLPTWVPRWDLSLEGGSRLYLPLWPMLTDRRSSSYTPSMAGTGLSVRAVVLDTVVYVSEVLHREHIASDEIAKVWNAISQLEVATPYPPLCRLHAFIVTLCGGISSGDTQAWERSQAAYLLDIHRMTDQAEAIDSQFWEEKARHGNLNHYSTFVQAMLSGKKVFVTERGYFGTAYAVIQKGDHCSIIFGCKTLSVLRRAESEKIYRLLGGAYITGKTLQGNQVDSRGLTMLGREESKDWTEWDVEEEDIVLH